MERAPVSARGRPDLQDVKSVHRRIDGILQPFTGRRPPYVVAAPGIRTGFNINAAGAVLVSVISGISVMVSYALPTPIEVLCLDRSGHSLWQTAIRSLSADHFDRA